MSCFGLNKTQIYLSTALLLLTCSTWPLLGYPRAAEDEDLKPVEWAEKNPDNEEDNEWVQDNNEEDWGVVEEEYLVEENTPWVENAPTVRPDCIPLKRTCEMKAGGMTCCDPYINTCGYKDEKYMCMHVMEANRRI